MIFPGIEVFTNRFFYSKSPQFQSFNKILLPSDFSEQNVDITDNNCLKSPNAQYFQFVLWVNYVWSKLLCSLKWLGGFWRYLTTNHQFWIFRWGGAGLKINIDFVGEAGSRRKLNSLLSTNFFPSWVPIFPWTRTMKVTGIHLMLLIKTADIEPLWLSQHSQCERYSTGLKLH